MDQPYSLAADWLSKFHTSSELIQALWILTPALVALGVSLLIKETIVALARRRSLPAGQPLYTVFRDPRDAVLVLDHRTGRVSSVSLPIGLCRAISRVSASRR